MKRLINIAIFAPFRFDSLYQRPQAIAEKLSAYEHIHVYFFDFPQRHCSLNNNHLDFSFSHAIKKYSERLEVIRVSNYFKFLGIPFRFSKEKMFMYTQRWLKKFFEIYFFKKELILFIQTPLWLEYINNLAIGNNKIYFDVFDDIDVLSPLNKKRVYLDLFIYLAKKAEKIFVTAEKLEEELLKYRPASDIIRVPNGVKIESFLSPYLHPEIIALKRKKEKIIGYVGVINKWIDIELIAYLAKMRPEYRFIFVGTYNKDMVKNLKRFPNIYLFGRRPHEEIPNLIFSFDVCLNPFLVNNIGNNTNPIKLFEYLALGKPIISTDIYEAKNFFHLIYVGKNYTGILEKLDFAANHIEDEGIIEERIAFAKRNSWDFRVEKILEQMEQ